MYRNCISHGHDVDVERTWLNHSQLNPLHDTNHHVVPKSIDLVRSHQCSIAYTPLVPQVYILEITQSMYMYVNPLHVHVVNPTTCTCMSTPTTCTCSQPHYLYMYVNPHYMYIYMYVNLHYMYMYIYTQSVGP